MKLLSYERLKEGKGIPYSKVQLWRLEKRDEFPKRIPLGRGRHAWAESEIDGWIKMRIAVRDSNAASRDRPAINCRR